MSKWWQHRSLKLRLTLWYAGATVVVLAVFAFIVYEVVEHRLAAEIDRQLRIDFDLVEAQLEVDAAGKVRWAVLGAHGDEGYARLSAWFEIWSEDHQLLLRHWPVREADIKSTLPPPAESALRFHTIELEDKLHVRLMERPARVRDRGIIVRLFRDESDMRHTLREIIEVFLLALPVAVFLASMGGYFVARRSLRPISAMAEQAKKITSESLSERLPVSNPHDEVGQLATVFNQTLQRLESSFAELKRFTADASHELRTPLTALRTVGEVALREADHPAISSMLEEAEHLQALIESLLTLARMEGHKVEMRLESLPLAEILHEVRDSLQVLATDKQQTIDIVEDGSVSANADRLLLRQALLNIVHNAVRYAPAASRITLSLTKQGPHIVIAVKDEGPGIEAEHHTKIFDRFYRVDKARARAEGGHGLGLAIAKWAVERQGGRIELTSQIGKGSIFQILLPVS
jgi:two-component system, OmpR family, sensor kinase